MHRISALYESIENCKFHEKVSVVVQIDWQQKKTLKTNNSSLNSNESQSSKVLTRKDI